MVFLRAMKGFWQKDSGRQHQLYWSLLPTGWIMDEHETHLTRTPGLLLYTLHSTIIRTSSRTGPEHFKMPCAGKRQLCKKVKPRIATCATSQKRLSLDVDLAAKKLLQTVMQRLEKQPCLRFCFDSGKVPVLQLFQNADLLECSYQAACKEHRLRGSDAKMDLPSC